MLNSILRLLFKSSNLSSFLEFILISSLNFNNVPDFITKIPFKKIFFALIKFAIKDRVVFNWFARNISILFF